jgi:hypothetical protein
MILLRGREGQDFGKSGVGLSRRVKGAAFSTGRSILRAATPSTRSPARCPTRIPIAPVTADRRTVRSTLSSGGGVQNRVQNDVSGHSGPLRDVRGQTKNQGVIGIPERPESRRPFDTVEVSAVFCFSGTSRSSKASSKLWGVSGFGLLKRRNSCALSSASVVSHAVVDLSGHGVRDQSCPESCLPQLSR